jgi:hypothetical protein
MSFAQDAIERGAAELREVQLKHALTQARRYIRFVRMANGTEGARYSMAEYLALQGVRRDLISEACQKAEAKYGY